MGLPHLSAPNSLVHREASPIQVRGFGDRQSVRGPNISILNDVHDDGKAHCAVHFPPPNDRSRPSLLAIHEDPVL